ncbi:MAG: hypothetical protein ACLGI6_12755 [Gammaproteobacteria bacterium]
MEQKAYWFPVRPAAHGWGWGLPITWQGWVVLLLFFVLLTGGSIVLAPYGVVAVIANGCASAGFLLAVAFWKGEPQTARHRNSP